MNRFKDYITAIRGWGLTALLAFAGFVVFLLFGFQFLSGICLGVFFTRNWDIIEQYIDSRF